MILVALDQAYRKALRKYNWPELTRFVDSAVSVASGTAYFAAPKDVRILLRVADATTPYVLQQFAASDLIDHLSGFATLSGGPVEYGFIGNRGINVALNGSTALEVISDGADTRTGWVRGFLSGEQRSVNFTLNGSSAVSIGNFDEVSSFQVQATDSSRTVNIRKVAGSTVIGTIAPYERSTFYRLYRLALVPDQTTVLRLVYKYTPPSVFSEDHEYVVPVQDYLLDFAIGRMFQQRRQGDLADLHFRQAEQSLLEAVMELEASTIHQSMPQRPITRVRTSVVTN
jgi:hypothetical protein